MLSEAISLYPKVTKDPISDRKLVKWTAMNVRARDKIMAEKGFLIQDLLVFMWVDGLSAGAIMAYYS